MFSVLTELHIQDDGQTRLATTCMVRKRETLGRQWQSDWFLQILTAVAVACLAFLSDRGPIGFSIHRIHSKSSALPEPAANMFAGPMLLSPGKNSAGSHQKAWR